MLYSMFTTLAIFMTDSTVANEVFQQQVRDKNGSF